MPTIGTTEILIIAAIILLLFGGKKLPELIKGVANAIKEFRGAVKEEKTEKAEE